MSRSYKKAVYKDGYGTKRKRKAKQRASRSLRRCQLVTDSPYFANGKHYKKHSDSYSICDYTSYMMWWDNPHPENWGYIRRLGAGFYQDWYEADKKRFSRWFKKGDKWHHWK